MRALLTPALHEALSLTDAETAQPLDILACVVAPPIPRAASKRNGAQPFPESKPSGSHAEFGGCLPDGECTRLLEHAYTVNL